MVIMQIQADPKQGGVYHESVSEKLSEYCNFRVLCFFKSTTTRMVPVTGEQGGFVHLCVYLKSGDAFNVRDVYKFGMKHGAVDFELDIARNKLYSVAEQLGRHVSFKYARESIKSALDTIDAVEKRRLEYDWSVVSD